MSYCPKITEFTERLLDESGLNTSIHIQNLEKSKYSHEKLDYAYEFLKKTPYFQNISGSRVAKSNIVSDHFRKKGNAYFLAEDYTNTLICFTQSILNAEDGSENLAAAYGARARLLFEKQHIAACVKDIRRALQIGPSDELRRTLSNLKEKAMEHETDNNMPSYCFPTPELSNKNPQCPSASNSLEIKDSKVVGRHVVAANYISVGEVLVVEKSFVHTVFPENRYVHCHECLNLCFNLIPCPMCTTALFCSEICRKQSLDAYHKYECRMIPLYGELAQNFVKMVAIALKQFDLEKETGNFSKVEKLVTNECRRESINVFYPIFMACIGYSDFKNNTTIFSDTNVSAEFLKDLIYKCTMIDSINSFNIKKYSKSRDMYQKVAQGIYPSSSFFNHSCAANCQFFFHGSNLIVRALANIQKGEECSICYNGQFCSFSSVAKTERQRYLREVFCFNCYCIACRENWPTFEYLSSGITEMERIEVNGNVTGEKEALQTILLQFEKVQSYASQGFLYLQNELVTHYKQMGNKIIDF
ncbi:hypothetical protein JTB14_004941 [Gonioctena quinquepunctata]|nr:hypothetical protein JTB14_004941 [Gonioctena quinquepunctata]